MDRDASLLGPSYSNLRKGRWAPVMRRWVEEDAVKETLQQGQHPESSALDFSYHEPSVARVNLHHSLTASTSFEHLATLPQMMSSHVQTIYAPVSAQAASTPAFPFGSPSFDGFSSLPFGPHNDWPFRGFPHAMGDCHTSSTPTFPSDDRLWLDESNAAFENHQNPPIPIQTPAIERQLGHVTDLALYSPLSGNIDNPTIAVASGILPSDTLITPQRLQSSVQPELMNDWPGTAWNTPDPGHGEIRTPVMALAASDSGYALTNICTPPEVTVETRSSGSLSSATVPLSTPSPSKSSRSSRKRAHSPGTIIQQEVLAIAPGEIQGMKLVWQSQKTANNRKMTVEQKGDRKRRMQRGVCSRCKQLKLSCCGLKESPYLPCEGCRKSSPRNITTACLLEASLLGIMLFRMGPPTDNPFFPLNFFRHRQNIFQVATDEGNRSATVEVELMQEDVDHVLNLTVSRFNPLPGDKLAYEGVGTGGHYRLGMPPYCISDINQARESLLIYIRKAKGKYLNLFLDRRNPLLVRTFIMATQLYRDAKRPLINKALDIWAATRLIERTWKLCGRETFGIHSHQGRSDPWKGFVPVTPIMDQQLDQVVIREVLVPLKNDLLNALKEKVYSENDRKLHAFELYLTFFILMNNAEMQLAAEQEFARRYGFSGRFGPRGKYMDAEAQFHAARTMLGHFHYISRANCVLKASQKDLREMGLGDREVSYLMYVRQQTKVQKPEFMRLMREHKYESPLYFCHQMLSSEWSPGHGHIEELPETDHIEETPETGPSSGYS